MSNYIMPEKIRSIRHEKYDETQEEFAERCGISVETLSNLERAAVSPKFETVCKIALAAGISLDEFAIN